MSAIHFAEYQLEDNETDAREVYAPRRYTSEMGWTENRRLSVNDNCRTVKNGKIVVVRTVPFSVVLFNEDGETTRIVRAKRIQFGNDETSDTLDNGYDPATDSSLHNDLGINRQ